VLASGEAGPLDGGTDLAAAIVDERGPRLVIFGGHAGLRDGASAMLALPQPGSVVAFGRVGGQGLVVVGAGEHLMAAETSVGSPGSPWRWSVDQMMGDRLLALTSDLFLTGTGRSFQLAAVTDTRALEVLRRPETSGRGPQVPMETQETIQVGPRAPGPSEPGLFERVAASSLDGESTANEALAAGPVRLRSMKTMMRGPGRDLLLLEDSRLTLFASRRDAAPERVDVFDGAATMEIVDAVPVRLNEDALDDLILLERGRATPLVVATVPAAIYTVNTLAYSPDRAVGDGICYTVQSGTPKCSLLAALQEANAAAGPTSIVFNLGTGTPTISGSGYGLQGGVTIDGATGGATRIRITGGGVGVSQGGCALRSLVIEGSGGSGTGVELGLSSFNYIENCIITNHHTGVHMTETDSHGNTIGGSTVASRNVISSNSVYGIHSEFDSYGNTIAGNFIGTNVTGDAAAGNGTGIRVDTDGSGYTIGGSTSVPGTPPGNVISGNGIGIGSTYTSNIIRGNLIGLRADGSASLANGTGIQEFNSLSYIGGTTPADRNVISGNAFDGLEETGVGGIWGGSAITGNAIGTLLDQVTPAANGRNGILSHGTVVSIWNNVIASNGGAGVAVDAGNGTWISANSIHSNGGLGIDLGPTGPTPNDAGDGDTGANGLQNFPVITKARFNGAATTIEGVLNSAPSTAYKVQLFKSPAGDPSGYGEGQTYLTEISVTTDGSGKATFATGTPGNVESLSATATMQAAPYNSSEFSPAFFNPGEASRTGTLLATRGPGTSVDLAYEPACGATNHAVYTGAAGPSSMSSVVWTSASCGLGVSGSTSFDPGTQSPGTTVYFVIVGQSSASEGSYGRNGTGVERPEAAGIGLCDLGQSLTASCDPGSASYPDP
jgi:hypothetical protein